MVLEPYAFPLGVLGVVLLGVVIGAVYNVVRLVWWVVRGSRFMLVILLRLLRRVLRSSGAWR